MAEDTTKKREPNKLAESDFSSVISAIRSPLSLFGLIVLVCNGVFAIAAASMNNIEAFKYAIHMFLAVVGVFVMIALWHPRSLYHPRELEGLRDDITGVRLPKTIITSVMVFVLLLYVGYQYLKT